MKKILLSFLSLVLFLMFKPAYSACTGSLARLVLINIPNITISGKEKIGDTLTTATANTGELNFSCGVNVASSLKSMLTIPNATETTLPNVYTTSISGIGVRIKWPMSRNDVAWIPATFPCSGNCYQGADSVLVELVKTGDIRSGVIDSGEMARIIVESNVNANDNFELLRIRLFTAVNVTSNSCYVEQKDKTIDLGQYNFVQISRPGFEGISKNFSVNLNCPTETAVKVKFEGTLPPGYTDADGIISTRSDLYDARNMAVKLTNNNMPLKLNQFIPYNNAYNVGTNIVTDSSLMRLEARLLPLAGATPGNINATLVYSFELN